MKRKSLAIITSVFVISAIIAASLLLHTQSTSEIRQNLKNDLSATTANPDGNNEKSSEPQNRGDVSKDQNLGMDNAQAADSIRDDASDAYAQGVLDANTNRNSQPRLPYPLPDGRIFLNSEPPYAYIPTCTSEKSPKIPLMPVEPDI